MDSGGPGTTLNVLVTFDATVSDPGAKFTSLISLLAGAGTSPVIKVELADGVSTALNSDQIRLLAVQPNVVLIEHDDEVVTGP